MDNTYVDERDRRPLVPLQPAQAGNTLMDWIRQNKILVIVVVIVLILLIWWFCMRKNNVATIKVPAGTVGAPSSVRINRGQ